MTKRTFFAGAMALVLVTGIATVNAQGRRGPAGQLGVRQNQQLGVRQGPLVGRGGRMGGGPLAGLRNVGLTDDQKTKVKAIFDEAEAERLAARQKTENAVLALLTPEQKAKLGKGGK